MRPNMKASTILSRMLQFWGPKGEHWTVGLGSGKLGKDGKPEDTSTFCILGAAGLVQNGYVSYPEERLLRNKQMKLALQAIRRAIPYRSGIPGFNDSSGSFAPIKAVVCKALKDVLTKEGD